MFPLACSCKLHYCMWKGEPHWILTGKTVFQALRKSLGNTFQPSFLVSSFFFFFFLSIKRIMVLILRVAFVTLSLSIACWVYVLLNTEAHGSQVHTNSFSVFLWINCSAYVHAVLISALSFFCFLNEYLLGSISSRLLKFILLLMWTLAGSLQVQGGWDFQPL